MIEPIERLTDSHLDDLRRLYEREWWTQNRTAAQVRRLVENSDVIVAFSDTESRRLVAFARVVTDFAIKALVLDVIVDSDYRQQGLGKRLLDAVVAHPALRTVRHLELYCRPELVPFYERWRFTDLRDELRFMRLVKNDEAQVERHDASPTAEQYREPTPDGTEQGFSAISAAVAAHYAWGQGCDGWHLVRSEQISVIEERMPAITQETPHFHEASRQFFYVLAGKLTMVIGQSSILLTEGAGIEVPPKTVHQAINRGPEDVQFLVISQPPSHGDRVDAPDYFAAAFASVRSP